ncbi:MAG TPA: glycine zipper 2TM domain-containing protein [Thermomonas sp.]|uniref:Glycine zipper 2TM domain-containing protein n=1 Tax=Thermomonas beijingensis TaxID=2872701 RepID=A0ABS7TBN5_9GAMM|nr:MULTISPECIES: glycine zipper 2TM domain-containing protein [Thermomonas]MBZ4185271.1 glycine zipper 2TM domain-containing protein [Thermomonas beijingensis]HOC11810.1 glycine zipper 2TM domain-containing protein [Thermomonas sp.]HQX92755.1 glycine zipper 2TM domain-containing protein [Thermomonas sp.]
MKRLLASLLALGLASASACAFAQSNYDGYQDNNGYNTGYDNAANSDGSYYDYAQVIRVDPVLQSNASSYGNYNTNTQAGMRCYDRSSAGYYDNGNSDPGNGSYGNGSYNNDSHNGYGGRGQGSEAGRNVATIAGGVVGAVLGSKIGGGSGTYAAAAVGSMLGGMAGRGIYDQNQRNRYVRGGTVRVCDPQPVRDGYSGNYSNGYASDYGNATAYDVTYEYNGRRYTRRMSYNPGDRLRVRVDVSPQ